MLHTWYADTDGNGKTVRVFLLDFSKALDHINHQVLISKMHKLDINQAIINWVIDFLSERKQRVKTCGVYSDWSRVNGGVPQGTVLGPILFLIMINDLVIRHDRRWKCVDDTTVSEVIAKGEQGNIQSLINEMENWCIENGMKLNRPKCKDLIISFAKECPELDRIFIQDYELTPVSSVKILGVHVSADLKWNVRISYIVAKASKRLYLLRLLKRAGVDQQSMLTVYTTCIRSVLEYGCQVWNFNAPQYLSEEVERIQKRALRLICPHLSYSQALEQTQLPTLAQRRNSLCQCFFMNITEPEHKLHPILPPKDNNNLRNSNNLGLFHCHTGRFKNSFIPQCISLFNTL